MSSIYATGEMMIVSASRKWFLFGAGLIGFFALFLSIRSFVQSGRFGFNPGIGILLFLLIHACFFLVRSRTGAKSAWISYVPSFPPAVVMLVLLFWWISTEAYLPCPEGAFCEDYLTPLLVVTVAITFAGACFSTVFELAWRPARRPVSHIEAAEGIPVHDAALTVNPEFRPAPEPRTKGFIRSSVVPTILTIVGGAAGFVTLYFVLTLIQAAFSWLDIAWPFGWDAAAVAVVLTTLFIIGECKRWRPIVGGILLELAVLMGILALGNLRYENQMSVFGFFLPFAMPVLALAYAYFSHRPRYYIGGTVLFALVGFALLM